MSEIILPHKWKPRSYQMKVWKYMQGPAEGKRAVEVAHRRWGKDLLGINLVSTKIPERVGTYWHLLPTYKQGRAIVWNGFTRDGRKFLDHFHPDTVTGTNSTEMRVSFYNGSNYQVVGTDDINSLVGTNPIGCIFSEYSLHDPGAWDYIRPILMENGGWALFIYTARGRNHGHTLLEMAKKNPRWFSEVSCAGSHGTKREDGSPVFSDQMIQEERDSLMPEAMIQQEYFCSFDAPFVGAYYGDQMMKLERDNRLLESLSYDPRLPLMTYWDIGVNDTTCIWFAQPHFNEIRIIDFYKASGEGLPHYAKMLRGQVPGYERMGDYVYQNHYGPWDIEIREFSSGKARIDTARELGIKFKIVRRHEVEDGIEAVRNILPRCWFNKQYCMSGIEALRQYRKKYDEENKCFQSHPLHDWTSNPADAFRYLAWAYRDPMGMKKNQSQKQAVDEHQYL